VQGSGDLPWSSHSFAHVRLTRVQERMPSRSSFANIRMESSGGRCWGISQLRYDSGERTYGDDVFLEHEGESCIELKHFCSRCQHKT